MSAATDRTTRTLALEVSEETYRRVLALLAGRPWYARAHTVAVEALELGLATLERRADLTSCPKIDDRVEPRPVTRSLDVAPAAQRGGPN